MTLALFVAASCAWKCNSAQDADDASTTDASPSDVVQASDAADDMNASDVLSDAQRRAIRSRNLSLRRAFGTLRSVKRSELRRSEHRPDDRDHARKRQRRHRAHAHRKSTDIDTNTADWNPNLSRCAPEGGLRWSAPIPPTFVVPDPMQSTPNTGLAGAPRGRTHGQTNTTVRALHGKPNQAPVTMCSRLRISYGPGIPGAHGGSSLSAIGGTLRLGELRPNMDPPHHVLKLELFAHVDYYNDGKQADCYRWPASNCDGDFDRRTSSIEYGGKCIPQARITVALPTTCPSRASIDDGTCCAARVDAPELRRVPRRRHGVVGDCDLDGAGTLGNFTDQFKTDWGFPIDTGGTTSTFAKDMAKLIAALEIVDNNATNNVGGGGTPLQPPAPPIADE